MINVRQKGQGAEREIANTLNSIIYQTMLELGYPQDQAVKGASAVQRNQQQTAVGGNDLIHTFGLGIEVKRQEQLSIPAWWRQCCEQSHKNQEWPVLLYRQNQKKWRCITYMAPQLPDNTLMGHIVVEFDFTSFQAWFKAWITIKFRQGYQIRV